jgi:glycosyltransferase involved in cell wall biosynthesis
LSISLIVIARNEEKRIGRLLESVRKQTLHPDEVIVVDNASMDSTAKVAKEYGANVIYEPVTIRGKALNTGFRAAMGDILAISGADWVLDSKWLEFLYSAINAKDKVGAVAGRILALNKEKLIPRLIDYSAEIPRQGNNVMMYLRRAVIEAGLWNSRLHNAEDVDMAQRVLEKGYEIVYEPRAKIYHVHPEKLYYALKRQYEYGYWNMIAKRNKKGLTNKEWSLMLVFPFIFVKHAPKVKTHPLLPMFLTLTTYAYTLGMWKCLLQGNLK